MRAVPRGHLAVESTSQRAESRQWASSGLVADLMVELRRMHSARPGQQHKHERRRHRILSHSGAPPTLWWPQASVLLLAEVCIG